MTKPLVPAALHGRCVERELCDLPRKRYPRRSEVIERMRARWETLPPTEVAEVAGRRGEGRR